MVKVLSSRQAKLVAGPCLVYYDGQCGFCSALARWLRPGDIFSTVELRRSLDATARQAGLTQLDLDRSMFLLKPNGAAYEGFYAMRQLVVRLPLFWPLVPFLWLPGSALVGVRLYHWVAEHRGPISRCPGAVCRLPGEE